MSGILVQDKSESSSGLPDAAAAAGALARAVARLGTFKPSKVEPAQSQGGAHAELSVKLAALEMTPRQRRRQFAFKAAAVGSLLLHAGSLVAFVAWHGAETGAVQQPSEAISVEIVASSTLESAAVKEIPEPAPSPEATAPTEGRTEAAETAVPQADPPPDPQPQATETPPAPAEVPEAVEDTSRQAKQDVPETAKTSPPPPVEAPAIVVPVPRKAELAEDDAAKRREPDKQEKARERAPKGGVTSKAQAGKGTGGERASASSGSLLTYAAHVRARVAANRPSGGGLRGTAVVSFGLTASGDLAYASVSTSSGIAALDQLAISAVRGSAPFPAPPAGATTVQLRFTIPFYFE